LGKSNFVTISIIILNLLISYRAYKAFESGGIDRDNFLLRPYQLSIGKNYLGAFLSQFSHVEFYHISQYNLSSVIENSKIIVKQRL
jgi:hypothetical protein